MSRAHAHETDTRRVEGMSPEDILGAVTAHLGRKENRDFEEDDGTALLSHTEHKCGDGRSNRLEAFGMFGGSLGLMAAEIANLARVDGRDQLIPAVSPDLVIRKMVDKLGGISCHTDGAHGPGLHSGCGHVARMITDPAKYGLTGRFGDAFIKFLKELNQGQHPEIKVDSASYPQKHDEIAVVQVVNSEDQRLRVRAFDAETGIQVFVFHKTEVERVTDEFGGWLFNELRLDRIGVSEEDFRRQGVHIIMDQTLITASELAPNFQLIQVEPTANKTLNIKPAGTVPDKWAMGMSSQG